MKKMIIENGWKMDHNEEMRLAAQCMTHKEYKEYKAMEKKQTENAFKDLKGMYKKADALYEDAIINTVGEKFFYLFRKYRMIQLCGCLENRKLYAI